MIKDLRIRVAAGLLVGVLSVLGITQAHAAALTQTRYACDARQSLTVERDASRARVNFVDRSYELHRKRSNIGVKYSSPAAALIIDGESAVFVAEDRLQLGSCTKALKIGLVR